MSTCTICDNKLRGQQVKYCSNRCKQKAHYRRQTTNPNTYFSQTVRALRRKLLFVDELGGGCATCGYRKNLAALPFHHLDASEKLFALDARNLSNRSMEILRAELKKCVLLCANCHAEEHHPESAMEVVRALMQRLDTEKRSGPAGI